MIQAVIRVAMNFHRYIGMVKINVNKINDRFLLFLNDGENGQVVEDER